MTKLILFTHPAVSIDPSIPIDHWDLSEEGFKQAKQALDLDLWKNVDVIYSSTELKAYGMAEKIAQKYNLEFDDSHKIYDLGETRNRTFIPPDAFDEAVGEWYRDPDHNINGWEPINVMNLRVSKCIDALMDKCTGQTVAIVAHGGSGTMIKCHIQGIPPSRSEDPHKISGGYFIADWDNKRIIKDWERYWK